MAYTYQFIWEKHRAALQRRLEHCKEERDRFKGESGIMESLYDTCVLEIQDIIDDMDRLLQLYTPDV